MLTVIKAIKTAITPAATNTHQPMLIRYAKFCNQLFMKYHANGEAMRIDKKTSFKKSFESKPTIPETLAPSTFRIPISFTFRSTTKVDNPNKPRHAIRSDNPEKPQKMPSIFCSLPYCSAILSSTKEYSRGTSGTMLCHVLVK